LTFIWHEFELPQLTPRRVVIILLASSLQESGSFSAAIVIFGGCQRKLRTQPPKISQPPNIGIIFCGFKVGPPKTNGPSRPPAIAARSCPPAGRLAQACLPAPTCWPPHPSGPTRRRRPAAPAHTRSTPPASPGHATPQPLIAERVATLHDRPHHQASHRPPLNFILPITGLAPARPASRSHRRPPSPPRR
jgi:hypothetical protein